MSILNYLDNYKIFYYTAETGSMHRAAEVLGLVPSTVTKAIHNLEDTLGCKLCIRSTRGVTLTAEGKAIYNHVKPAMLLIEAGERDVQSLHSLEKGSLVIGLSGDVIPNDLTSNWLVNYCNMYPGISVEIISISKDAITEALASGRVDIVIAARDNGVMSKEYADLALESIYEIRDVAVVGKKYKEYGEHPVTLEQLAELPLVFATATHANKHYAELFREHGINFTPKIKTYIVGMQINAVRSGLGYTFVPETSIKNPLKMDEVIVVNVTNVQPYTRQLCIFGRKEPVLNPAARAFVDVVHGSENNIKLSR